MHLNYFFLRQVSYRLQEILPGKVLDSCFTQSKDEAILYFNNGQETIVRALLSSQFTCLSFPDEFNRRKINSTDLFAPIINKEVIGVQQHRNERAFSIHFSENLTLTFKLFGNRSNLVLQKDGKTIDMLHSSMKGDSELDIRQLERDVNVDKEHFMDLPEPNQLVPTLGPLPVKYLNNQDFEKKGVGKKWQLFSNTLEALDEPESYYLTRHDHRWHLSLLPIGSIRTQFEDPLKASTEFFRLYISDRAFSFERRKAISFIEKRIGKSQRYIKQAKSKLQQLTTGMDYHQIGDILMANLHDISPNMKSVTLHDFYNDREITIKLKASESPQKNAANYYRKAKNQHLELERLESTLKQKSESLDSDESLLQEINDAENIKDLRKILKKEGLEEQKKAKSESLPFYDRTYKGYRILIGKGAKQNDKMLQSHTWKEDLWLHAKDSPGSHVIIKQKPGQNIPKSVIEKAAQFAAYYSKAKNDTLCPVTFTKRKYVRKRKGDPPGMVAIEKESVILVEPSNDLT